MTEEEEGRLLEEQERSRISMLESILSVPLGRSMFLEPLRLLVSGQRVPDSPVDDSYWDLRDCVLPEIRRREMDGIMEGLKGTYLNRDSVRRLHLLWHSVEDLGRKVFSGLRLYRDLILKRNGIMEAIGDRVTDAELLAAFADDLESEPSGASRRAWRLYPALGAIQNDLDLMEVRTGTGLLRYSDAGKRFSEAMDRIRDITERFVEANLCLVISRVRRFHPCDVMEEMDLVQEGCQGLMEAVRRKDEVEEISRFLPSFDTKLKVAEPDISGLPLEEEELSVLRLVDGKRSIEQTLEDSEREELETLDVLEKLFALGIVSIAEDSPASQSENRIFRAGKFVAIAAAIVAVAVLARMTVLMPASPADTPYGQLMASTAHFIEEREIENLHFAIAAYRLNYDVYPNRLSDLVTRGFVSDEMIRNRHGVAYSYSYFPAQGTYVLSP